MMKLILFLTILSCLSSCFQQSNSNITDNTSCLKLTGSDEFKVACDVLNTKCISCHSNYHNDWANLTSESQWADLSTITPGNSDNSLLVERIHGCGSIDSGDQMPEDAERLTADECKKITDWIDSLD